MVLKTIRSAGKRAQSALLEFLALEAASGLMLMAAALAALIAANSPASAAYDSFRTLPIGFSAPWLDFRQSLLWWVNDALMVLFFLVVAIEIKRESVSGQFADRRAALLPLLAALGGMVAPALIFLALNASSPLTQRGWAIPAATDIAFALGVMSLLGARVPLALKVLLTAIAIADDLGAILIIALFYTDHLATAPLAMAGVSLLGLIALNRAGTRSLAPYLVLGAVLWLCVLKSGVHATLAGVALGFCLPLAGDDGSAAQRVEKALHPWVAYAIVPLFAFVNAGLSFDGLSLAVLAAPLPAGIALGLFLGKQVGIFGTVMVLVRLRIIPRPPGCSTLQVLGMAMLAGIGFTMSLFIGGLAFRDPLLMNEVRLGVMGGSVLSAVAGSLLLIFAARQATGQDEDGRHG